MRYNLYHKHTHYSNIFTPDTHVKTQDYIARAKELEHSTYFTTEHGWGGDIFESNTLCQEAGLHCKFGVEGYIVHNNAMSDKSNYHIVVIPKTNTARRKLNKLTSRANLYGFYYKPRLSVTDMLTLDPNDVFITTACIAGITSSETAYLEVFKPLAEHFGRNLMLEVQAHWDFKQVDQNKYNRELSRQFHLPLIAATDSHYIYQTQYSDRLDFLKGKKIFYPDEGNFTLDYPDYDTLFNRFVQQGVLTDKEIQDAIERTLIFDDCEDIQLDKKIKMPNIYQNLSPEERFKMLEDDSHKRFDEICRSENLNVEEIAKRRSGLDYELGIIRDTIEINTQDYFLLNTKLVRLAIDKYGGILTPTGRGSAGALYLNKVLGITQIDRFNVKIPLYPERFISKERLLENHSLPDYIRRWNRFHCQYIVVYTSNRVNYDSINCRNPLKPYAPYGCESRNKS